MLEKMRENIIKQAIESLTFMPILLFTLYILKILMDQVGEVLYWLLGM